MSLIRLIYASKTTSDFGPEDIASILQKARINNSKNEVTGLLCFNNKYFLQCLEGSRKMVNQTYHQILNDKRHSDILILDYFEVIEREFDKWSMGYMPQSNLIKPLILKYSGTTKFDPYEMSGKSAYRLMLALKETIPDS